MTGETTAEHAVDVLNRIHAADPTVLSELIDYRVACDEALRDDPTVQVGKIEPCPYCEDTGWFEDEGWSHYEHGSTPRERIEFDGWMPCSCNPKRRYRDEFKPENAYEVGLLGVINGIFGIRDDGKGHIAAYYDAAQKLEHFEITS